MERMLQSQPPTIPVPQYEPPPPPPKKSIIDSILTSPMHTAAFVFVTTAVALLIINPPFIHAWSDDDTARGPVDFVVVVGWSTVAVIVTFILDFVRTRTGSR